MAKINRNSLCACGSGKKYKKCCLNVGIKKNSSIISDLGWINLRKTEDIVINKHLNPYLLKKLPPRISGAAMVEFFPEDMPDFMDSDVLIGAMYVPWVLFNWFPDDDIEVENFSTEKTISENYLDNYGDRLSQPERKFIEAMNKTFYSFFCVLDVEFEKSITAKDILLGKTYTLKEISATHRLKRGDIIFSRVLTLNEQSIFIGTAPYVIPTQYNTDLIRFRDAMIADSDNQPLTEECLRYAVDLEVLDYFFNIMGEAAKPITLTNTDGDIMLFCKSYFELKISPKETLHKLLPLTLSKDLNEVLDDEVVYDSFGEIESVVIMWQKKGNKMNKSWGNTIIGHIQIEANKLSLDTNSKERSELGKNKLLALLGEDNIRYKNTLIESVEQGMQQPKKSSTNKKNIKNTPELSKIPEEMIQTHWETWFDISIPALNNETPREAAKSEKGMELLEALLLQYDRSNADIDNQNLLKADTDYLRKALHMSGNVAFAKKCLH